MTSDDSTTIQPPKDLTEMQESLVKVFRVIDLCFQNEGDKGPTANEHLFAVVAIAEEATHYTYDLLTGVQWETEMEDHMKGRDEQVDELALDLLQLKAFLKLLALSGSRASELDVCGLFGLARNLVESVMEKVEGLRHPIAVAEVAEAA